MEVVLFTVGAWGAGRKCSGGRSQGRDCHPPWRPLGDGQAREKGRGTGRRPGGPVSFWKGREPGPAWVPGKEAQPSRRVLGPCWMALGERLGRVQNPHLWRAAASAPEGARRRAPCPQALARPSASPPPQGTWTGTTTRCSPGSGRTASWSTWTTPGGERPRPAPRGPPGRLAFAFFFGHRRLVFVAAVALP